MARHRKNDDPNSGLDQAPLNYAVWICSWRNPAADKLEVRAFDTCQQAEACSLIVRGKGHSPAVWNPAAGIRED